MNHDEFDGQIQARARLGSRGDAEQIIRATLETLAERLEPGLADNIASQLPQGSDAICAPTSRSSGFHSTISSTVCFFAREQLRFARCGLSRALRDGSLQTAIAQGLVAPDTSARV